jgi:hypothetical protein
MIAAFARRRTPMQRLALLVLVVVLADFSIPDGCDCDAARTRTAATITTKAIP